MIISEALMQVAHEPWQLLLIINLLLLIVGMFFEGGAAMVLLAPLLVPAVSAMDIDLIHFGIVMCINLTIAGFTPPFGSMLFVSTSITNTKISDYIREAIPFIVLMIALLLMFTFVPQIIMLGPNLLS